MDGKLQKVLLLEKDIEKSRIDLAKEYVLNQGNNPNFLTDTDLLAIYSALVMKATIKAEENCKNLKKGIDKM